LAVLLCSLAVTRPSQINRALPCDRAVESSTRNLAAAGAAHYLPIAEKFPKSEASFQAPQLYLLSMQFTKRTPKVLAPFEKRNDPLRKRVDLHHGDDHCTSQVVKQRGLPLPLDKLIDVHCLLPPQVFVNRKKAGPQSTKKHATGMYKR
jgi:hypothetical protein